MEDLLAILAWDAGTAIAYLDTPFAKHGHCDLCPWGCVNDSVLDKVSKSVFDSVGIGSHLDRLFTSNEGDCPLPSNSPWSQCRYYRGCSLIKIHDTEVQLDCVQSGDPQKLLNKAVHASDVIP
jgi:hypothetical protein